MKWLGALAVISAVVCAPSDARACSSGAQDTKEAKEVFRLLHQKYPGSEWARRAKYVY